MTRYQGQIRFAPLGEEGQARLRAARAAVVGLGALGYAAAGHLVRAGVGFLRICDRDFVELGNLHRQSLYDEGDARACLPKAAAAAAKLALFNSEVSLDPLVCDVNGTNAEEIARDVDLVLDCTDNFETRFVLNDACVKLGRPWIYAGCVGGTGMAMAILPGEGPCFACLAGGPPVPGTYPPCETAGVLGTAAAAVGAVQATEAIKILSGRRQAVVRGLVTMELWTGGSRILEIPRASACETCVRRRFPNLEAGAAAAVSLCGRDSVQVLPSRGAGLDLAEMESRLAPLGEVRRNRYLLKFSAEGFEMTLFPDGRAIIRGAADPARAKSLYYRYVGA